MTTQPQQQTETLIDDCFYIKRQRWGTFVSVHKDGHELITALNEDLCMSATRFYLKGLQDGWDDDNVVKHEGTVGGKL